MTDPAITLEANTKTCTSLTRPLPHFLPFNTCTLDQHEARHARCQYNLSVTNDRLATALTHNPATAIRTQAQQELATGHRFLTPKDLKE